MNRHQVLKSVLVISLLLLQAACSGPRSAKFSASDASSSANGPGPSPSPGPAPGPIPTPNPNGPAVNPPRFSPSPGNWVNVTSNLAGMNSECGNMTYVSSKPSEDLMIAGIALQGLWGTRNGGASWQKMGTGAGSANILNRPSAIIYDPIHPNVFYESGIYNGMGIFKTDDAGGVFKRLGDIDHNDSVSVDFSDPLRLTLLAGTHEQSQKIFRSQDGGSTWVNVGGGLPADTAFSSFPLVINSKTFFAGIDISYSGRKGGILQSNDSGLTWTTISSQGGGSQPLVASDGSIYWPSSDGSMIRGTGSGSNWTWKQTVASGTLMNRHPVELPDGRIASLSNQRVMISADKGVTWQPFGAQLPYTPTGLAYSDSDKAFYIWMFDCGNKVLPNAIMKMWL